MSTVPRVTPSDFDRVCIGMPPYSDRLPYWGTPTCTSEKKYCRYFVYSQYFGIVYCESRFCVEDSRGSSSISRFTRVSTCSPFKYFGVRYVEILQASKYFGVFCLKFKVSNPTILEVLEVPALSNLEILELPREPAIQNLDILRVLAVFAVHTPEILRLFENLQYRTPTYCEYSRYSQYMKPKYCEYSLS